MHELNKSGPRRGWGEFFLNKFFLLSFKVRAVKAVFINKKIDVFHQHTVELTKKLRLSIYLNES